MATNGNNTNTLIPSYLEADFLTALTKNTELMKASDTFKDYNYHGANMTMLLELLSYLADFSSFHTNMVAKNVYMDSATVYETVHSLAQQKGYNARGYISPWVTVNVELSGSFRVGDEIYVAPWQSINTGLTTDDGDSIWYTITDEYTHIVETLGTTTSFQIPMRQGKVVVLTYTGQDIIDNNIILPFHDYDYGTYPFTIPAINVYVEDEKWNRVSDFYDQLSGLIDVKQIYADVPDLYGDTDDVFMFKYDKYRRYVVQFDTSRNVPEEHEDITIKLLESLGSEGGIRPNALSSDIIAAQDVSNRLVFTNTTQDYDIKGSMITRFYNEEPSIGGSNPESIQEIKTGARSNVHSQYRNITGKDYRYHLEARSDVVKGLAWGEQEVDPGNVLEYNKTYVTVIPEAGKALYDTTADVENTLLIDPDTGYHYPYLFALGTINTEVFTWSWTDDYGQEISAPIEKSISYVSDFENDLLQYLEPRKMLNNYEVPVLPDIVYFRFDIGIRVRRTYNFKDVMTDVRNKLDFFFEPYNRIFKDEISFMDIHNFILDLSITSTTDDFKYIAGVDNLVLRDLGTYTTFNEDCPQHIFEPHSSDCSFTPSGGPPPSGGFPIDEDNRGRFPQFKYQHLQYHVDNKLRPILLDYNQFPMISIDMCRFYKEI